MAEGVGLEPTRPVKAHALAGRCVTVTLPLQVLDDFLQQFVERHGARYIDNNENENEQRRTFADGGQKVCQDRHPFDK